MSLLTREQILAAKDFVYEDVEVPEWGGSVRVRGLNARELDEFEQTRLLQRRGKIRLNLSNTRARLCALCIVGDDGKRLFTEHDITVLAAKYGKAVDRVYEKAAELSGIKDEDLEDVAKNLENGQPAASL